MLSTATKLVLAAALLTLFVPDANAQRVHPRCVNAKDKVRCTCGVENGATFVRRSDGRRRMIIRQGEAAPNDGYARCLMRHGRI